MGPAQAAWAGRGADGLDQQGAGGDRARARAWQSGSHIQEGLSTANQFTCFHFKTKKLQDIPHLPIILSDWQNMVSSFLLLLIN